MLIKEGCNFLFEPAAISYKSVSARFVVWGKKDDTMEVL